MEFNYEIGFDELFCPYCHHSDENINIYGGDWGLSESEICDEGQHTAVCPQCGKQFKFTTTKRWEYVSEIIISEIIDDIDTEDENDN